jgi:P-type E1-E2 ATPase
MLDLVIPGFAELHLEYLVLDVNGTLTKDGVLLPGVTERLGKLRTELKIELLSGDTFGRLDAIAAELGLPATALSRTEPEPAQKAAFIRNLGASRVVAIGNGANDADMLKLAALGIAVLGPEGLAVEALLALDLVVSSIDDALDLLRFPRRLLASLRR